jgi:hypothetical protein
VFANLTAVQFIISVLDCRSSFRRKSDRPFERRVWVLFWRYSRSSQSSLLASLAVMAFANGWRAADVRLRVRNSANGILSSERRKFALLVAVDRVPIHPRSRRSPLQAAFLSGMSFIASSSRRFCQYSSSQISGAGCLRRSMSRSKYFMYSPRGNWRKCRLRRLIYLLRPPDAMLLVWASSSALSFICFLRCCQLGIPKAR